MIVSLYGLWVEDTETKGHGLIGYFETFKEVNNKLDKIKKEVPEGKKLVVFDHDYDEKRNVITEFNFDQKIYV